jgi:hypothetical protein
MQSTVGDEVVGRASLLADVSGWLAPASPDHLLCPRRTPSDQPFPYRELGERPMTLQPLGIKQGAVPPGSTA